MTFAVDLLTSSGTDMLRVSAISFSPNQQSSSRLMLVRWPRRVMERLTFADFICLIIAIKDPSVFQGRLLSG